MLHLSTCRSCGAPVYWLKHATTGKLAPVDAAPNPSGNVTVDPAAGTYTVLGTAGARADTARYTSHFMPCPQCRTWRRASIKPTCAARYGAVRRGGHICPPALPWVTSRLCFLASGRPFSSPVGFGWSRHRFGGGVHVLRLRWLWWCGAAL
jgi:hypothetical protein